MLGIFFSPHMIKPSRDAEGGPVWAWLKNSLKTGILQYETPAPF
jgi:hypothetical protein